MLAATPLGTRFRELMREVRAQLDAKLFADLDGTVQSGPFDGMKLLPDLSWKESNLSPLLLGCYEEDIHAAIEAQIKRLKHLPNPSVAVVGCAEGYYAVGLARRLPHAKVYAVDIDAAALAICQRTAEANGVSIVTGASVDDFMRADYIVMDCEGAEVAYLDLERFPHLAGSHVLVEVHNKEGQPTDEILLDRFRSSHRITFVFEGPRCPTKYPCLSGMHSDMRWAAVSESRPCLMGWFVMEPKGLALA